MPTTRLTEDDRGVWLVDTRSGSTYVFDMDTLDFWKRGEEDTVEELHHWVPPVLGEPFAVSFEDGTGLTSSPVVRIRPGDEVANTAPTRPSAIEQIVEAPPRNAWLLLGDDASFPTGDDLREQRHPTAPLLPVWTSPKQIQPGDLVFLYFIAPRKAVHFVTRAHSGAVYDPSMEVNALKKVDAGQWWVDLGPLVPIQPVPFRTLREAHGGALILQGKPTNYLTPRVVEQLIDSLGTLDQEQQRVLQLPTGDPHLPDPSTMTLGQLRDVAAGALKLEKMVEHYVVEPLLRLCFGQSDEYRVEPQFRIPKAGIADYALFSNDALAGMVEVKIGIRFRADGDVEGSPDLQQLRRYCEAAGVPGLLIDANSIHAVDFDSSRPIMSWDRAQLGSSDLVEIRSLFEAASVSGRVRFSS